jgi:superfamily II DNA or RNA helicase
MENTMAVFDEQPRGDSPGTGDFRQGDRVSVRRERWLIADLHQHEQCQVLTLSGIGASNLHRQRRVLAPFELVEPLRCDARMRKVHRGRWRRSCRALLADTAPWAAVHAAERAAIEILPHQLEPSLAILRGLGCRVLLADDVGLGKTIQAGLIVSELLARGAAERVLLLTPAGLRDQWANELRERFGLTAGIMDQRGVRALASTLPREVNPWSTVPLAIASLDYVKRAEVLPAAKARVWDVVLVDEAHLVGPETDRYGAVASLCDDASYVVLLTATPHSGDRHGFRALCALGSRDDPLLVFRRTRADVRLGPTRHVTRLMVRPSAAEARMHRALARYAAAVRTERGKSDRDVILLLTILLKRALSSAESLRRSLARRLASLTGDTSRDSGQLWLPLDDEGGELDGSDEPPVLRVPALKDAGQERRLIRAINEAATVVGTRETKLAILARLLRRLRRCGEPAIVFTEYRDTLIHIRQTLQLDGAVLHGGLSRSERRRAVEMFVTGRAWTLLATDAGAEGLNLHRSCRVVIHMELPWNPVRLEQRTGRVDRIGQARTVHAVHLIARQTGEMRILARLQSRIREARRDIAVADPLHSPADPGETSAGEGPVSDERESLEAALDSPDRGRLPDEAPGATVEEERAHRQIVRLVDEAEVEARRIRRSRVYGARGDQPSAREVSFARGAMRAVLRGRALILVGFELDDPYGRRIAVHVSSLLVVPSLRIAAGDAPVVMSSWLESRTLADALATDRERAAWETESRRTHHLFWRSALARSRAIEQSFRAAGAAPFQPRLPGMPGMLEVIDVSGGGHPQSVLTDQHRDHGAILTRRCAICHEALNTAPATARTVLVLLP